MSEAALARILALLLASCVSLCKLSNFSGLQFLLDFMGYNQDPVILQHLGLEKQYIA